MCEVGTSDVGLDMPCMRIHRHEAATKVALLPFDGVERAHQGIYHALVVGENLHLTRRMEGTDDGVIAHTRALHVTPTVGLTHGAVHDAVDLFLGQAARERSVLLFLQFLEETLLLFLHMFVDRLFGITLHT